MAQVELREEFSPGIGSNGPIPSAAHWYLTFTKTLISVPRRADSAMLLLNIDRGFIGA
jgi:hypothetical protein